MTRPTTPYVAPLDTVGTDDVATAGGKGTNLGELVRAGLPVPSGFVVTTTAYEAFVDTQAIHEAIDRLDSLEGTNTEALTDVASELRSLLRERAFATDVEEAVDEALEIAGRTAGGTYAVRSSATAEDLPSASFAGQHDSSLGVAPEDVLGRVRDCMVSLFTDRAVAYRVRTGISHADVSMAVVVQEMVDADAAGVLFTADPDSGNRTVATVDASFGLGEAVVASEVTPDHARVDKRTGEIIDYAVGEKEFATRPSRGGTSDTERVELSAEQRRGRVLSESQLRTLVDLGSRIEALFDAPQDIEWAVSDGGFQIVQSRPITSLFPLPDPMPADDRLHVYLSLGHMQAMSEAMPPLVQDFWKTWMSGVISQFGFGPFWPTPVVTAGSRIYIDLTPALRVERLRDPLLGVIGAVSEPAATGLRELIDRRPEAFEREGLSLSSLPVVAGTTRRVGGLAVAVAPAFAAGALDAFQGPPTVEDLDETWGAFAESFVPDGVTAANSPGERARAVFTFGDIESFMVAAYPRAMPLYLAFGIDTWMNRAFTDAPETVNKVGRGFERDVVTRINLGLGDIADVAREHPAVAESLQNGASLEAIAAVEGGEEFEAAFEAFLEDFGHRATSELDLSRPRWREDPATLLGTVRANLANEDAGEHRERVRELAVEAERAADELEARADHGLLGPVRRRVARKLVETYRNTIYSREYPKHYAAEGFAIWREALLDSGRHLASEGVLDRPEDVWFLRKEELFAALDGDPIEADIEARRREVAFYDTLDEPPLLTSEGETPRGAIDRTDVPDGALLGTGVSTGVVEGPARVVHDPTEATVEGGEILVAPSADPGWTPLFLNAAGMVVEVGGRVSHGALVAREYGLPAVVSVPNATEKIKTGQRIRIDGSRGIVEILDDERDD
ncbi:PEP/pyruvate-binding domain-containing protein [Halomarina oriensis]|uniref:Pyruvate, phosphate dikinase n=1 Tax=Halomarina oriensis TaxID=671145 RepID=A0A6B0GPF0_9EURY|nr:PEP/pyruvate-binding domain-containing protein [Halomarina oriensis]MWG33498.1 pyruvate, phosphate dikinase [Halomarina oriensis]